MVAVCLLPEEDEQGLSVTRANKVRKAFHLINHWESDAYPDAYSLQSTVTMFVWLAHGHNPNQGPSKQRILAEEGHVKDA